MRLSYSKISSYEKCPKEFWLTNIKKVPFVANKYIKAGLRIHELLKEAQDSDDYKKYLMEHPEYQEFKVMIDNFIEYQDNIKELGGDPKPIYSEYKLYDPELDFSLIIDRIDSFNGRGMISDWKSDGKVDREKHDKQLIIYSYMFNKLKKKDDPLITDYGAFLLKFDKKIKNKKLTEDKVKETIDWLKRIKSDIDSKGIEEKNYPAKTNEFCKYCSHYTSGLCKEGKEKVEGNNEFSELLDGDFI